MKAVKIKPAKVHYNDFLVTQIMDFVTTALVEQEAKVFIKQAQAHKRFGRGNVERWVKSKKATTYHRPNGTVEYKMAELLRAAENQQEYLYQ